MVNQTTYVQYREKPDKGSDTKIQPTSKTMLLKLNFLSYYRTKLEYHKGQSKMETNPQNIARKSSKV